MGRPDKKWCSLVKCHCGESKSYHGWNIADCDRQAAKDGWVEIRQDVWLCKDHAFEAKREPLEWIGRTKAQNEHIAAILNATRGYSPEFVAAAIRAVEAKQKYRYHDARCAEVQCNDCGTLRRESDSSMLQAIYLLPPKAGTDA